MNLSHLLLRSSRAYPDLPAVAVGTATFASPTNVQMLVARFLPDGSHRCDAGHEQRDGHQDSVPVSIRWDARSFRTVGR